MICCRKKVKTVESESSNSLVPFEELMTLVAGCLGRWQWISTIVLAASLLPLGMNMLLILYLTPPLQRFYCTSIEISDSRQQCYTNNTKNQLELCTKWNFSRENGYTMVEKWNLVCADHHLVTIYQIADRFCLAIGFLITGTLADWYGRKKVLITCMLLQTPCGLTAAFVHSLPVFMLARCIYSAAITGTGSISCIMVAEIISNKYRSGMLSFTIIFFGVGLVMIPLVSQFLDTYSELLLVSSVPQVILIFFVIVLEESPIWLLATKRILLAEKALKSAAKMNGCPTNSTFRIRSLQITCTGAPSDSKLVLCNLLDKTATKRMSIATWLLWFLLMIVWVFALNTCILTLQPNLMTLNLFYLTLCTLLGLITCAGILILHQCERLYHGQIIWFFSMLGCIFASIALLLNRFENSIMAPSYIVIMLSIYMESIAIGALWNLTPRMFPTKVRGTCTGSAYTAASIGIILGERLAKILPTVLHQGLHLRGFRIHDIMATSVLLTIAVVIYILTLSLYVVEGRELPDTIEDSYAFNRRTKPQRWTGMRFTSPTLDETEVHVIELQTVTERRQSLFPILDSPPSNSSKLIDKLKNSLYSTRSKKDHVHVNPNERVNQTNSMIMEEKESSYDDDEDIRVLNYESITASQSEYSFTS